MSAAQVTPDDGVFEHIRRELAKPASAQVKTEMFPLRGHEGLVTAEENCRAPRGQIKIFPARVARIGRVQPRDAEPYYMMPELLFDDATLAKFDRIPITIGHDTRRIVGTSLFPRIESEKFIVCDLYIDVRRVHRAIALGLRQLSYCITGMTWIHRSRNGERRRILTGFASIEHIALVRQGGHGDARIIDPSEEVRDEDSNE